MRRDFDLYFDTGDVIKAGNLAVPVKADPVWPRLASLGITASTLGNRETHVLESAFRKKTEGAQHPIIVANLRKKDGTRPFLTSLTLEVKGLRVGLVGVMVAMVTERMKTQAASAYLWDPPIPIAAQEAEKLRPEVDLLIALTHIGHTQDRKLAEACNLFDLILGGHSHTELEEPDLVNGVPILQTGSHAKRYGAYTLSASGVEAKLVDWP